jgi:hypothetical protein
MMKPRPVIPSRHGNELTYSASSGLYKRPDLGSTRWFRLITTMNSCPFIVVRCARRVSVLILGENFDARVRLAIAGWTLPSVLRRIGVGESCEVFGTERPAFDEPAQVCLEGVQLSGADLRGPTLANVIE